MSVTVEKEDEQKRYMAAYGSRHQIPTVKHYREIKNQRKEDASQAEDQTSQQPRVDENEKANGTDEEDEDDDPASEDEDEEDKVVEDTSQALAGPGADDPKAQRKAMKKRKSDEAERSVTDPVTHLPIKIHDFTTKELKETTDNKNFQSPDWAKKENPDKGGEDEKVRLQEMARKGQRIHREMERLYPPPDLAKVRNQLARVHIISLIAAITSVIMLLAAPVLVSRLFDFSFTTVAITTFSLIFLTTTLYVIHTWTSKKVSSIFDSATWEAERTQGKRLAKRSSPESTEWLNALLAGVWPLINPDLFISVADTLEDVMQASLPKLVRMISVEDIGQGSESIRILGIKWLPRGAATKTVTEDGKLENQKKDLSRSSTANLDEKSGSKGDKDGENSQEKQNEEDEETRVAEGLHAEMGDFINVELTVAFRARLSTFGLRSRSKNPHIYLAFYLPGGIKLPVWVELRGLIATLRLRLHLTPDPPFTSNCTLTFLGQPKVDLACVPLIKKGLNIMDLPLISNFVQSSIDAAVAEYVAPKSLTLDLKSMLMGADYKKDTSSIGLLVVRIRYASGFKEGDSSFFGLTNGSTDGYITVGWAKFGKPVWSTRVITADMTPVWEETAFVLVTTQEINVREKVRVQLWDSDRMSADDDLGRIEVDLEDVMHGDEGKGKMWKREDGFRALKAGEAMPGKLTWEIGWFAKNGLLEEQLKNSDDKQIKADTVDEFKRKVFENTEKKVREASKDESQQIEKQKAQDLKESEDDVIIGAPPPEGYPSGILSIVIHQIQGLELAKLNKKDIDKEDDMIDESSDSDDLPSSYCIIVLNHQKIYKTRTKPKNAHPFFNAGTERFVPDIRKAHVHIAVRDARVHEDNALLGVVDLPLGDLLDKRSQISDFWPVAGGVGYGKIRISMVFRSVSLQVPKQMLGWNYGTLEVDPEIKGEVGSDLQGYKIKVQSSIGHRKYHSQGNNLWKSKSGDAAHIPVSKRYASCVTFEIRANASFGDKTQAFAILWLKDISDDEQQTLTLPVWKGDINKARLSATPEPGEKAGHIEVKLTFWSGLSGYHVGLAKNDDNVEDVMQILDCAADVNDEQGQGSDPEDSSDDEDNEELKEDGKRTMVDDAKEYKTHMRQLHRQNKGMMQWKIPRTLKWMGKKVERSGRGLTGVFGHHETSGKVETEV